MIDVGLHYCKFFECNFSILDPKKKNGSFSFLCLIFSFAGYRQLVTGMLNCFKKLLFEKKIQKTIPVRFSGKKKHPFLITPNK